MLKTMKPGRHYIIVNIDEPYARALYEVLKAGQIAKGQWPEGDISFEEWIALNWPEEKADESYAVRECEWLAKQLRGIEP